MINYNNNHNYDSNFNYLLTIDVHKLKNIRCFKMEHFSRIRYIMTILCWTILKTKY